ncbi:MAG: hypothetical protein ABJQ29_08390 [Luteolibacter sp.]
MKHQKLRTLVACTGLALACLSSANSQTLVDLSDTSVNSGMINGAIYMIDGTQPAGTGIFGRNSGGVFLTIQNNGVEEGYNTSARNIMDTKRIPQWNHEITVATLGVVTVDNKDYVPFLLDINETANDNKRLLSLDDVKIFTTQATGITNPTLSSLVNDSRLTLRYDMDAGANNSVLLDYGRSGSGSGKADMALLVPVSVFDGAAAGDTVYFYSRFGGDVVGASADSSADAGFEEWTAGTGRPITVIPEPSAMLLGLIGALGLLIRRKR